MVSLRAALVDERNLAAERFRRHVTYGRLEATSTSTRSSLPPPGVRVLIGKPQPATFLFVVHGALRRHVRRLRHRRPLPRDRTTGGGGRHRLRGVGPFIGSIFFVRYADIASRRPTTGEA
jgi:hypothetical protein